MSRAPIDWTAMDEESFHQQAKNQIWLSAFAANNPRAPAHKEADAAYEEAKRRGKPWMYNRAWNAAYRLAGYEPSEDSVAAAQEPSQ